MEIPKYEKQQWKYNQEYKETHKLWTRQKVDGGGREKISIHVKWNSVLVLFFSFLMVFHIGKRDIGLKLKYAL